MAELELYVDPALKGIRPYVAAFACDGISVDEAALEQLIEAQEKLAEGYGRGRSAVAIGIYGRFRRRLSHPIRRRRSGRRPLCPAGDGNELTLRDILSEHPTGEKYAHLLEDVDKYPLISDSLGKVLSMPP